MSEEKPERARPKAARASATDTRTALLRAAEASAARARARRAVPLAIGMRARVRRGQGAGSEGTVLDADYIENRVLLRPDGGEPTPLWLPFADVDAIDDDTRSP